MAIPTGGRKHPAEKGMEIMATAREMTRLLEFGGEPAKRRARDLAGDIIRHASAVQRYCDRPKAA